MRAEPQAADPFEPSAKEQLGRQLSFAEAAREEDRRRDKLQRVLEAVVDTYCNVPDIEVGARS